ncbi:hypothetical protein KM800_13805 [Clostridium tyrobutyricum]|uniref:hypothetical protein n=1 Tax=Clostridium tyrobutyricum TaxID=1519 RepID=UPI001C393A6D|nr:hypothetical protein [Clostridium tyrobutyricum]MBV4420381.1 hypothetical protein [Clostridium tyrobutyricum]
MPGFLEKDNLIRKQLEQYLKYFENKSISINIESKSTKLLFYDKAVFYKKRYRYYNRFNSKR